MGNDIVRLIILTAIALGMLGFHGAGAVASDSTSIDFAKQVEPILSDRCYSCHGEKKGLGGLRLHTRDLIAALEDDGLVVAGDPESSELYARLILPDDDKQRMPKGGKPLKEDQIEAIKLWIEQGAHLAKAEAAPADHGEMKAAAKEEPLPAPPAAASEAIEALRGAGATIVPLYSGSTLLSVGFPSGPSKVTDEHVNLLLAAADNIAWLNLGNTRITDEGARKLSALKNLSRLHLENTAVTDAAMGSLAGLTRLEYLNLYGTQITDAALAELQGLSKLSKLYVWQTAVTYDAAMAMQAAREGLEINLGWDHPGVVRARLSDELARAQAEKTEADKTAKMAEDQLAAAKQRSEAAAAREQELQAQLAELDKPAADAEDKPATEEPAGEDE